MEQHKPSPEEIRKSTIRRQRIYRDTFGSPIGKQCLTLLFARLGFWRAVYPNDVEANARRNVCTEILDELGWDPQKAGLSVTEAIMNTTPPLSGDEE